MIFKIFKLLLNIKFLPKNYKKINFIIYDSNSIEILKKHLLKKYNYFVIDNRIAKRKLYVSLALIFYFINKYLKLKKKLSLTEIYFLALIEFINPKLVFNCIDIDLQFSNIARHSNKKIKFMTLQLTRMPQRDVETYLFKKKLLKKNLLSDYYYQNYLGFGKYQYENIKKNNIKLDNFISVGSLNLANFLKSNKKNYKKKIYDICLISDEGAYTDKYGDKQITIENMKLNNNTIKENFFLLIKWTIKLVKEKKFKFAFVFKRKIEDYESLQNEIKLYKDNLNNNEFNFLLKNASYRSSKNFYNSYDKLFKSKITLAVSSTLLIEGLITDNKVLSCNFTGLDSYNFPIKGICSHTQKSYNSFENKVLKIIRIKKQTYYNQLSRKKDYLSNFVNPEIIIKNIKTEIDKFL